MVTIYVTYEGDTKTRFDRDYYVRTHLPLVRQAWGALGLLSADAYFPAEAVTGMIALCECRFRDEAAIDAALSSSATPAVMADVVNFTDALPRRCRVGPFQP